MDKNLDKQTIPDFDALFNERLETLFRWRRDVRRFKSDPIPADQLQRLLERAILAPSVGNSQPWRFVIVDDITRRQKIRDDFEACNQDALNEYAGEKAKLYATLKLSGLDLAPVHLAVYCDHGGDRGQGLGQKTMPEMLDYSVVSAINTLWLAARAESVGMGWVSILNPDTIDDILDVPDDWRLVAYLCLGYPTEEHDDPELVRHGWQDRATLDEFIVRR